MQAYLSRGRWGQLLSLPVHWGTAHPDWTATSLCEYCWNFSSNHFCFYMKRRLFTIPRVQISHCIGWALVDLQLFRGFSSTDRPEILHARSQLGHWRTGMFLSPKDCAEQGDVRPSIIMLNSDMMLSDVFMFCWMICNCDCCLWHLSVYISCPLTNMQDGKQDSSEKKTLLRSARLHRECDRPLTSVLPAVRSRPLRGDGHGSQHWQLQQFAEFNCNKAVAPPAGLWQLCHCDVTNVGDFCI